MFIFGRAGSSLSRGLFPSCAEWGLRFFPVEGFSSPRPPVAQALGHARSVAVTRGLSFLEACGMVPDQGSNPCVSPALASGPFTTEPLGKPWLRVFRRCWRDPSSPARQPPVIHLAPSPLLLEEMSPEDREPRCAGPEGAPGMAGAQASLLHQEAVHAALPGDTMPSAPSALWDLLEIPGGFLGMVATQGLSTLAPQR